MTHPEVANRVSVSPSQVIAHRPDSTDRSAMPRDGTVRKFVGLTERSSTGGMVQGSERSPKPASRIPVPPGRPSRSQLISSATGRSTGISSPVQGIGSWPMVRRTRSLPRAPNRSGTGPLTPAGAAFGSPGRQWAAPGPARPTTGAVTASSRCAANALAVAARVRPEGVSLENFASTTHAGGFGWYTRSSVSARQRWAGVGDMTGAVYHGGVSSTATMTRLAMGSEDCRVAALRRSVGVRASTRIAATPPSGGGAPSRSPSRSSTSYGSSSAGVSKPAQ
ncbi:hypothetical protein ACFQX6_31085 [Streptosporangium lutulentum]